MKTYIIASSRKSFNKWSETEDFREFNFIYIDNKKDLNLRLLNKINPDYIFFPHWNWIVPKNIITKYNCVCFHTSPLPYGRGGSPIQNLILRGYKNSPVCALKMTEILDAGPIYCKKKISLSGSCEQIFERINTAIKKLMLNIIKENLIPKTQKGKVKKFKRLSNNLLPKKDNLVDIYNKIRMLDSPDYPKCYVKYGKLRIEFKNAKLNNDSVESLVNIAIDEN